MSEAAFAAVFDERKVDALFEKFNRCHLPGAAVGIAVQGKPVYRKGFGLANMELPVVLSPTIRMRIASISKHITALAFMLLCEDGKAAPDDRIGRYLTELHPVAQDVTMRQLMGNIGGLHDAFEICHQFSGIKQSVTSEELLSIYIDLDEVNAAPGTAWIYNNGGFLMLSVAIERITGRSLETVLDERIFQPIGMHDTMLRRWDTDFALNSAAAHTTNSSGDYAKSNNFGTAWAGEGGIVSTVDDMLRWLAHMDKPMVGSTATWEVMRTPLTLANGTSSGYGLGLIAGNYRGISTLHHPGGGLGSSAHILKVPAAGIDIIVMINSDAGHAIEFSDKILDVCIEDLDPIERKVPRRLATGVFRSSKTNRVVQLYASEGEQIASIDGYDLVVAPDSSGVLSPVGGWRYYKQSITLDGDDVTPTSIKLSDFGNVDDLVRAEPAEETDLAAIVGRYRSKAASTEIMIFDSSAGAKLRTFGRFGSVIYLLEYVANGIWRAKTPHFSYFGGILSFEPDLGEFRFFSSLCRMWGLRFYRVH